MSYRDNLINTIRNADEVRRIIADTIGSIAPMFGEQSTETEVTAPDYDSMSDEELAEYLARGSQATLELVRGINDSVSPKLNSPIARMAIKSIVNLIGA